MFQKEDEPPHVGEFTVVCASAVEEVYWKGPLLFSLASFLSPTTPPPQQCSWNVIVRVP